MSWLTGWSYRKNHIINPASGAGQNYQKRIVVHFGAGVDSDENVYLNGKCRSDFGDIRFTNIGGAFLLDYWIEKKVDSDYAFFWVEIINDLSVYDAKIYIYYGKVGATSVANGDATFTFFDDFEIDLSKWTIFGSPVLSTDQAYLGIKSVKIPPLATTILHGWLTPPAGNKAVHVHFYDEFSPLTENAVFSIDAGELEASFIGIINDIDQYEYQLDGIKYNSGVDRTIGWHEFVVRSSENLKQFIIDGNLMPVTGISNYCPDIHILGVSLSQIPVYWDSCFATKFVNPEPSHGIWGVEMTEAGITAFEVEDIENSISMLPLTLEDVICSMIQEPRYIEDTIKSLLGSTHTPAFLSEDVINLLSGSIHIPVSSEDIINSLTRTKNLTVEDVINLLSLSYHISIQSEDTIRELLAERDFDVVLEFPSGITRKYPVIGGQYIIQVGGG